MRTDPALIRGSPIRSVSNRPVVVRCGIRPGRNEVSEVDLFPSYCIALQVLVAHAVGPGRGVNVGAHLADEGQRGTLCALDRVEGVIRVVSIACRIQTQAPRTTYVRSCGTGWHTTTCARCFETRGRDGIRTRACCPSLLYPQRRHDHGCDRIRAEAMHKASTGTEVSQGRFARVTRHSTHTHAYARSPTQPAGYTRSTHVG